MLLKTGDALIVVMICQDCIIVNTVVFDLSKLSLTAWWIELDTLLLAYKRLLSSQDKKGVAAEIQKPGSGKKPEDIIRDPYVLEFMGLECADKSESIVRYILPKDNRQIFTSKYKLYLPSEEELRQELQRNIMYWMMLCKMKQETSEAKRKWLRIL